MEFLTGILIQHMKLGEYTADLNWLKCSDLNGKSKSFNELERRIKFLDTTILKQFNNLNVFLEDEEMELLRITCNNTFREYLSLHEEWIERVHRPSNLVFDSDAVINRTNAHIPEDIMIALSFGNKFVFPYGISEANMKNILALTEYTIDGSVPPSLREHAAKEVYSTLKNVKDRIYDPKTLWLNFLRHRTTTFFKQHDDIAAIRSDKGNHVIIIDIDTYKHKVLEHLNMDCYTQIDVDPLKHLIDEELKLHSILMNNPEISKICKCLEPNTLNLARFYCLLKVHKNYNVRPITSTIGSPGYNLSQTLNILMGEIFPRNEIHIKDSFSFKKEIDAITLKENDIMVSMDVVSMYTSIPVELVISTVMKRSSIFYGKYGLKSKDLASILNFLLRKCSVFVFDNNIYRQNSGLPMGGGLSAICARIIMDEILEYFLTNAPFKPTFIRVFVDDSIFILNRSFAHWALDILNDFLPNKIKFTMENEENNSINFLNLTLHRTQNGVTTDWYMKSYASNRLLNYYSSHKSSIIIGTAKHFIKTVLILSDPSLFEQNKARIINRLRLNNFPEDLISILMSSEYTYFKPFSKRSGGQHNFYQIPEKYKKFFEADETEEEENSYISFPHALYKSKRIKKILCHYKHPGITLADSIRNTRVALVRNLKTPIPFNRKKNLIAISRCKCGKRVRIERTEFNQTGATLREKILNNLKQCSNELHAHEKLKFMKGLAFGHQTHFLLKYLRWINRSKIADGKLDWPNKYLTKLIKDKPL